MVGCSGCCGSRTPQSDEENIHDKQVGKSKTKKREKDKRSKSKALNLLLLGTAESGKSTFIKQMKIIHGGGYSKKERNTFKRIILKNICMSIESLLRAMETFKLEFDSRKAQEMAGLIRCHEHCDIENLEPDYVEAVKFLWNNEQIKVCFSRRREFQLIDSAKYFLDNIDRIAEDEYIPSDQDILRSRLATSGVQEYTFKFKDATFNIIDVGGQRYERSNWGNVVDSVMSVIFLASLSEYDQTLTESNDENRMEESLALFYEVLRIPWFSSSTFILFLNKIDLFVEKIKSSKLENYFPGFFGLKSNSYSEQQFILDLYSSCSDINDDRTIYHHFTCATDTENINKVFEAVKDTILVQNLKQYTGPL